MVNIGFEHMEIEDRLYSKEEVVMMLEQENKDVRSLFENDKEAMFAAVLKRRAGTDLYDCIFNNYSTKSFTEIESSILEEFRYLCGMTNKFLRENKKNYTNVEK